MKKRKNKSSKIIIIVLSSLLVVSFIINIVLFINSNRIKNERDGNIVFFGDSITEQYEIDNFFPTNSTINSGIGGNTSVDLLKRIDKDVYRYNPSKVFLLIGINDLCTSVVEEKIINNIGTIISEIKNNQKNCKIYVESIYPINEEVIKKLHFSYADNTNNGKIKIINKEIKKLCKEYDVTFIDIYSSLIDKKGNLKKQYTVDGVHLNNFGYRKVTSILKEYIM